MPKRFTRDQIFSMKVDPERWLVLETTGVRDWNLRIVGPEPLEAERLELNVFEAKNWAVSMAKEHFRRVNPRVIITRFQQWREALFVEPGFSTAI